MPAFYEALCFWLKLGFISFGGPAGQIAIMHEFLVEKRRWISERKFLHALNYCMLLPGPEAQQLATYVGWMLHGVRGGLAAGVLFVLPSTLILLVMSLLYVRFGHMPAVNALFDGLKPAVVAIVLLALFKIGKRALHTPLHYAVALGAFAAVFVFQLAFPLVLLLALLVAAVAWKRAKPAEQAATSSLQNTADDEHNYLINQHTVLPHTGFDGRRLARQLVFASALWLAPLLLLRLAAPDFDFWKTLSLFFTQAALVTFGGAYAVLPYVAQVAVEKMHWLSELQMLDGLALGETTPGPLIMVLAFVGFMAGYQHFGASLAMGALGLATTVWYTFLPSFLFIFAGAPIIERSHANPLAKFLLGFVTAAVVGVIAQLSVYLGRAVLWPPSGGFDALAALWMLVSFAALYRFKVNMILWIGLSALAGLARWMLVNP